jgi:hypothetical protein
MNPTQPVRRIQNLDQTTPASNGVGASPSSSSQQTDTAQSALTHSTNTHSAEVSSVLPFLQGISSTVIDFAADIEAQNFQHLDPSIDSEEFKNRVAAFIYRCQNGREEFTQEAFHRFLGTDLSRKYNKAQELYKANLKYQTRLNLIKDFLPTDGSFLDFGGGDLRMGKLLQDSTNLTVHGCDEFDQRDSTTSSMPFYQVQDHTSLPDCVDGQFEGVSTVYVLHHVDSDKLGNVLDEIHRISKGNAVILEESFDIAQSETKALCRKSKKYAQMTSEQQLQLLKLRDYFRNIVVRGITEMNMPFEFKRIPDWKKTFEQHGFQINDTKVLGFESDEGMSHSNFNVVFSLKKI